MPSHPLPCFKNLYRPNSYWKDRLFTFIEFFGLDTHTVPNYKDTNDLKVINQAIDKNYTERKNFTTMVFLDNLGCDNEMLAKGLKEYNLIAPYKRFYSNSTKKETVLIYNNYATLQENANKFAKMYRLQSVPEKLITGKLIDDAIYLFNNENKLQALFASEFERDISERLLYKEIDYIYHQVSTTYHRVFLGEFDKQC